MHRRQFLSLSARKLALAVAATPIAGAAYGFASGTHLKVDRVQLTLPNLPSRFQGLTIAFLSDIHHGPYCSLDYVAGVVRTVASLDADLIILGGDYSLRETRFIAPCLELLGALSAPFGVYAVLGNHDYAHGLRQTHEGLKQAKIVELTNEGVWLSRGPDRLRLAGVDDLWHGQPDAALALADATTGDACILVSHNPDLAETLRDTRVGLMLSGHTHGGQINVPGYGAPLTPSRYGRKYVHGLAEAPCTQVFTSAGTGMSILPVRVNCRPEVNLITLG